MPKRPPRNTTEEVQRFPELYLHLAQEDGTSNMIEEMEKQGQTSVNNSDTLPTEGSENPNWAKVGVKFGDKVEGDELFRYVELPAGWKKQSTGHSMWNNLVDEKGRIRASFFYKAAFYDRGANIHMVRRYSATYAQQGGDEAPVADPCFAVVKDGDKEIWRSLVAYRKETKEEAAERSSQARAAMEVATTAKEKQKLSNLTDNYPEGSYRVAERIACEYLDLHFPLWGDTTAYWD